MTNDTTPAAIGADAWMDPDTRDVINAERKQSWLDDYGIGGRAKAATYTVPLVRADLAGAAQPAPIGADALREAAYGLIEACERDWPSTPRHRAAVLKHAAALRAALASAAQPADFDEDRALRAQAAPAAVAGPSQETCQTCQGNGEVVTDWERYKHPLPGDVGDEAVAECQDCDGQGTVDAAPTTQAAQQPAVQHAGALEATEAPALAQMQARAEFIEIAGVKR